MVYTAVSPAVYDAFSGVAAYHRLAAGSFSRIRWYQKET